MDNTLTLMEAASRLQVTVKTVRSLIGRGLLRPTWKMKGMRPVIRITEEAFTEFTAWQHSQLPDDETAVTANDEDTTAAQV